MLSPEDRLIKERMAAYWRDKARPEWLEEQRQICDAALVAAQNAWDAALSTHQSAAGAIETIERELKQDERQRADNDQAKIKELDRLLARIKELTS